MKKLFLVIMMMALVFNVSASENKYQTVVVISIDALHPDAVQRKDAPNIFKLIDYGFYSPAGTSTKPPKTLIAHTAMITGLSPELNGKKDNEWKKGDKKIDKPTMLDSAKQAGYETALIYSKQKLGFLSGASTDKEIFSGQDAVEKAVEFIDVTKQQFIFLHISGLDTEGPISGWMSPAYIDEFNFIDEQLGSLFDKLKKGSSSLIIVTSDHAGHEKIHGSDHPEDFKRPLIIWSSKEKFNVDADTLTIEGLKRFVENQF